MTTEEAVEERWELVPDSGKQPYRNRGYYTATYLLIGPKTREEAQAAVQRRRDTSWPVTTWHLGVEREPGVWSVAYIYDCTD